MEVTIKIFYYNEDQFFDDLINELKNKKPTSIEKDAFGIVLELNVNSFDEIIYLLKEYNSKIEITLSIYADEVRVYISSRKTCSLGNQVE